MSKSSVFYKILKNVEPYYNIVNLLLSSSLLLLSFFYFVNQSKIEFAFFAVLIGFVGIVIFVLKNKIDITNKLMITIASLFLFVVRSFLMNGFIGSGFLGIALLITICIIFFSSKRSLLLVSLAIIIYSIMAILVNFDLIDVTHHMRSINEYKSEWYAQLVTLLIFSSIVYISIQSIKIVLVRTLKELETKNSTLIKQSKEVLKQKEQLRKLAYFDQATMIYNNYYLTEILPYELTHYGSEVFVAIIDITELKVINSIYAFHEVEQYLKDVVDIFKKKLPAQGILGRYSSDELIFIIPNYNIAEFHEYLTNSSLEFKHVMESLSSIERHPYFIAYTLWNSTNDTIIDAYKTCRIAIEYAQKNSADYIVEYKDEMSTSLERSTKLLSLVEGDIEDDTFQVWYQGKFHLEHQNFIGFEALSRWFLKTGEFVSPAEFIPLINNSRYLIPFNEYIIKKSVSEFEKLQNCSERDLSLSLNISPLFLQYYKFEDFIHETIRNSLLNPSQIILEITEDIFLESSVVNINKINRLIELGYSFSLDDFGSGYSSLNQLNSISIREVKIDRSIISNITKNQNSQVIVELVSKMGEQLGFKVVAEGIENEEEVNLIAQLGINIIQGYYYSKPQSIEQFIQENTL